MTLIFLDIDGVICLAEQWGGRDKKMKKFINKTGISEISKMPIDIRTDNFDQKAVKILNQIIEATNAEIVISSDWKLHATLEELGELFIKHGVSKKPIATTPNHVLKSMDQIESTRVGEINEWIEINKPDKWVAIDDLNLSQLKSFVHTKKMNEGIKQSGIKELIIKKLMGKP